jgi:hypothetical protein
MAQGADSKPAIATEDRPQPAEPSTDQARPEDRPAINWPVTGSGRDSGERVGVLTANFTRPVEASLVRAAATSEASAFTTAQMLALTGAASLAELAAELNAIVPEASAAAVVQGGGANFSAFEPEAIGQTNAAPDPLGALEPGAETNEEAPEATAQAGPAPFGETPAEVSAGGLEATEDAPGDDAPGNEAAGNPGDPPIPDPGGPPDPGPGGGPPDPGPGGGPPDPDPGGSSPLDLIFDEDDYNVIDGTDSPEMLTGTNADDLFYGRGGDDQLNSGAGDDLLLAGSGNDDVNSGAGDDRIEGEAGDDDLMGGAGADTITGGAGDDTLAGNAHDDLLAGGTGQDLLTGGSGADGFAFQEGDGSAVLALADVITDFNDGTDSVLLTGGLTYDDLTITDSNGDGTGDAVIQITATGEYLATLSGISVGQLTDADFGVL